MKDNDYTGDKSEIVKEYSGCTGWINPVTGGKAVEDKKEPNVVAIVMRMNDRLEIAMEALTVISCGETEGAAIARRAIEDIRGYK